MKIKVSELIGPALDWAVAKCERGNDFRFSIYAGNGRIWVATEEGFTLSYSTDWAQGGPIIQREEISWSRDNEPSYIWAAWTPAPLRDESEAFGYGNTQLIAACRCYVASILGDEVDVPIILSSNIDFSAKSKLEILHSFGYQVSEFEGEFKASITDDPEAFTVVVETKEEAIGAAYQFLLSEVDPAMGYIFPSF